MCARRTNTHTHTHTLSPSHIHTCARAHTYTHPHVHRAHTQTHTQTHAGTHTHTQSHTHTGSHLGEHVVVGVGVHEYIYICRRAQATRRFQPRRLPLPDPPLARQILFTPQRTLHRCAHAQTRAHAHTSPLTVLNTHTFTHTRRPGWICWGHRARGVRGSLCRRAQATRS